MLKTSATVTPEILQQLFNQALTTIESPSNLKNADVTLVFKKNNPISNEKPVSVLPIISNVFENSMQYQINLHIIFFVAIPVWLQKGLLIVHML